MRWARNWVLAAAAGLAWPVGAWAGPGPAFADALAAVKAVGREGANNAAARDAWKTLAAAGADDLFPLFDAYAGASPVGRNYLDAALTAAADRLKPAKKSDTAFHERLRAYAADWARGPLGRERAFELLESLAPATAGGLVAGFRSDPSLELRRRAVAKELDASPDEKAVAKLSEADKAALRAKLLALLTVVRDRDQVDTAAGRLRAAGHAVDLPTHYGYLTEWLIAGPFDNRGGVGYPKAYPPETERGLRPDARYPGKNGEVTWKKVSTKDDYGDVDLNKELGKHKGAVVYAAAVFESQAEKKVEFRLGSIVAWKLFLNGELLREHRETHSGTMPDQYVAVGTLKPGRNVILFKSCQNEQKEPWAQGWQFQLRVCEPDGTAVLSADRKKEGGPTARPG